MQRVGLIGYGAIGCAVHRLLLTHAPKSVEVVAILARRAPDPVPSSMAASPPIVQDLDAMLVIGPDLVVECAGHDAVHQYARPVLRAGIDMMLVSVVALADREREQDLRRLAAATGRQLLLPAGAIGSLDWLGAARTAGLTQVLYRARKPPRAWVGSAAEDVMALAELAGATSFFQGSAREAAQRYPRNANVAATVALAGLGLDATRVELIADPGISTNIHEIEAQSTAGNMATRIAGQPDADNARTSIMTAHSVVRTILQRRAAVVV